MHVPAVTAVSSASVRDANAWLTRRSNSSFASVPRTNAALTVSIPCSRSATFGDGLIPVNADVPRLDVVFIGEPDRFSPIGGSRV